MTAGLGTRFVARIIDSIILGVITTIIGFIIGLIFGGGAESQVAAQSTSGFLGFLIFIGYETFFLTRSGQTPGKQVMNIKVVRKDNSDLNTGTVIVRCIGYWIGAAVFLIGFIWAFFNEDRQTWHDLFAGTIVVKA